MTMNRLNLLEGVALGASVVYLFDPYQGPARRRRLATRVGNGTRAAVRSGPAHRVVAALRSRNRTRWVILRRSRRDPVSEWDVPMATVNIDVDQGTVTLRGVFPPAEEPPVRVWPHRGFTRAPMRLVEGEMDTSGQ